MEKTKCWQTLSDKLLGEFVEQHMRIDQIQVWNELAVALQKHDFQSIRDKVLADRVAGGKRSEAEQIFNYLLNKYELDESDIAKDLGVHPATVRRCRKGNGSDLLRRIEVHYRNELEGLERCNALHLLNGYCHSIRNLRENLFNMWNEEQRPRERVFDGESLSFLWFTVGCEELRDALRGSDKLRQEQAAASIYQQVRHPEFPHWPADRQKSPHVLDQLRRDWGMAFLVCVYASSDCKHLG